MFKIGAADVVTPEQARDQARTLLARHLVGDDPIADRRKRQEIPTVSALCALFLDSIRGKRKSSTVYGYSKLIECHIEPGLGQRKADALDPALVSRWHSTIGQSKPAAANRALRLLSTIYRWAHHSGILAQEVRPARATTKYREVAKERYLSGEEVQRLWAALDQAEREGIAADPSRSVLAAKRNRGIKRPRRLTASSSVMRWTWHGVKVPVMVSRPSSHCVGHPLSRWSTYARLMRRRRTAPSCAHDRPTSPEDPPSLGQYCSGTRRAATRWMRFCRTFRPSRASMQSQCWTRGRPSSWRRLPSAECVSCSTSARRVLNGKAHNDVSLPVTFTFRELLGAAEVMLRKGTVEYTVSGDVTVDSPFGRVTRPYKTTARIDNATLILR